MTSGGGCLLAVAAAYIVWQGMDMLPPRARRAVIHPLQSLVASTVGRAIIFLHRIREVGR